MSKKTDAEILEMYREVALLDSVSSLLWWDTEVLLPKNSQDFREQQSSALAKMRFERFTRSEFADAVMESDSTDPQIRELKKQMSQSQALDSEYVAKLVQAQMRCQNQWREARSENDFSKVAPHLEHIIELKKEGVQRYRDFSALRDFTEGKSDYEVLLDHYDPGLAASDMRRLLSELLEGTKERLPKILEKQKAHQAERHDVLKYRVMPLDQQKSLLNAVILDLGFDTSKGRLDVSTHPFCGGSSDDIRMTTRYRDDDFTDSLYSGIHEAGHALYTSGLPEELRLTPCGTANSFGVHESQSRLYENNLGRSMAFFEYLEKRGSGIPADKMNRLCNWVEPSFIRVDADEVTYNLHIALRFQIEEELISGKLQVADLPEVWNTRFKDFVGLEVSEVAQGCLQDTHWYFGAFGYFPSYSLGNILGAQIFEQFAKEAPDWESKVRDGSFSDLLDYLRKRVHSLASIDETPERIRKILNGEELGVESFFRYIDSKYLAD